MIEPESAALRVTSDFGFDGCGNLSTLRVIGAAPDGTPLPARTTTFHYGSRCQLPETTTNARGEATTVAWRYDFGLPARETDANGLATNWTYDEFGRRTGRTAADGTRRSWSYQSCPVGNCWGAGDLRFAVVGRFYGADGALVREQQEYYDGYERVRRAEANGAMGAWVRRTYDYDVFGRPVRETRPYSTTTNGHTQRTFDLLGRVTSVRDYDAAGVMVGGTTLAYAGRSTTLTDVLGRAHVRVSDVTGKLRSVADPAPGGTSKYDYDAFGNVVRIEDAGAAVSIGTTTHGASRSPGRTPTRAPGALAYDSLGQLLAWSDAEGSAVHRGVRRGRTHDSVAPTRKARASGPGAAARQRATSDA